MIAAMILAGLVLLYFGAEGLVRGSASLALKFGMTPLMVGLTVAAFGTSSPELVVSAKAAYNGLGDIVVECSRLQHIQCSGYSGFCRFGETTESQESDFKNRCPDNDSSVFSAGPVFKGQGDLQT